MLPTTFLHLISPHIQLHGSVQTIMAVSEAELRLHSLFIITIFLFTCGPMLLLVTQQIQQQSCQLFHQMTVNPFVSVNSHSELNLTSQASTSRVMQTSISVKQLPHIDTKAHPQLSVVGYMLPKAQQHTIFTFSVQVR